ncbi:tRNA modification GTPase MnmE [Desulfosarcina ovata subsp. sediminis]|uniref:tRNA modification GTPase MnmE n=1 Tax=Desulfosarcina ovata subsp. sediminis TaxID=885957 RepID=A0A5K7ZUY2_9BACT|nr:tRNA uridine-5-carboxymethylaminomethyl(34) synthesis GTPase MnmE [Desulfosarcina ovata]BBO84008.1 tRNA modification GTPase MnmE [Desulfosarcina ovata subsp. sediminis]
MDGKKNYNLYESSTIAAIATPLGPAGIGVIRISGSDAKSIVTNIFIAKNSALNSKDTRPSIFEFKSHQVYYGNILDYHTGTIIDEAIVFYMKRPNSFTREDVVEIQCHSGIVNLNRILNSVLDSGAKIAEAGEFTKRAFLNGRIDLSQAEGIIDLINAPCKKAAEIATNQMSGHIKQYVEKIKKKLIHLKAQCEAKIEFEESAELENGLSLSEINHIIFNNIFNDLKTAIQQSKDHSIYSQGISITIAGIPNVGKSSLLNTLVESDVAIVSEVPGTTRDVLKENINIYGIPVIAFDTAGIHHSDDPIEIMGIKKAHQKIEKSDIILFMLDATRSMLAFEKDFIIQHKCQNVIIIVNKIDKIDRERCNFNEVKKIGLPVSFISAKHGNGIKELKSTIYDEITKNIDQIHKNDAITTNFRQRKIFEKAVENIQSYMKDPNQNESYELISELIDIIIKEMDDITGDNLAIDIYEEIFKQFCIGK